MTRTLTSHGTLQATAAPSPAVKKLLGQLQRIWDKWGKLFKQTLEVARQGGECLTRLQQEVGRGQWLPLVAEIGISRSTAANWQRIYQRWEELEPKLAKPSNVQRVAHCGVKWALALLANPARKKTRRPRKGEPRQVTLTLQATVPARLEIRDSTDWIWKVHLEVTKAQRTLGTLKDVQVVNWKFR